MSSSHDNLLKEPNFNIGMLSILKKINIIWLIVTALVFIALVKLGFWQSSRALEKEQRLDRIEILSQQSPISLQSIVSLSQTENINDFPVIAQGTFNSKEVFLLDNKVNKGRLGYQVLQVVHTEKFAALVNLGWVQGSINRQELPDVIALSGEHSFEAKVRLVEAGIVLMEQDFSSVQWPLRLQQVEVDKLSTLLGTPLLPFILFVDETQNLGFVKKWQPIVMPPEKHQGYAFQWFSLAIAWLSLMCWAAFGHNRKESSE